MADTVSLQQLDKKREKYKTQLLVALQEEEDPLALYEEFVKWTIDNYPGQLINHSGLLELLEEATRQFIDDPAYKGDLRYLKLWLLFASHVEDPTAIYAFLMSNDIGVVYAQVFEEYATALERKGRCVTTPPVSVLLLTSIPRRTDAERVYLHGIKRRARPVERLKKRYAEFQARASSAHLPSRPNAPLWKDAPPDVQVLRRNPLMNHSKAQVSATVSSSSTPPAALSGASMPPPANPVSSGSGPRPKTAHDRYALMLAPPAPGKRPEKLGFNLGLLFTEDHIEYSVQEARARSMGLLGKKWAPLPVAKSARVNFNDDGHKDPKHTQRKLYAEPTVTINTKEALADVFGMYNSPEKSMRFGTVAGSKYAPLRTVEAVTPMAVQPAFRSVASEGAKTPSQCLTYHCVVPDL